MLIVLSPLPGTGWFSTQQTFQGKRVGEKAVYSRYYYGLFDSEKAFGLLQYIEENFPDFLTELFVFTCGNVTWIFIRVFNLWDPYSTTKLTAKPVGTSKCLNKPSTPQLYLCSHLTPDFGTTLRAYTSLEDIGNSVFYTL